MSTIDINFYFNTLIHFTITFHYFLFKYKSTTNYLIIYLLYIMVITSCLYVFLQVFVTTGIGAVSLSLDELNFCLEWDEKSPLWVSKFGFH